MFGFSRRRMKLGRLKKVQLSESSTPGARSPLRPPKQDSSTHTEEVAPTTASNSDEPHQRCSSAAPAEINGSTSGNSDSWMVLSIAGNKPIPRFNHAATVIGNKMIVVGGESGQGLLDDVQVLDFDQFTWSTVSSKCYLSENSLPLKIPACKGHGLVAWGKKALLVGGKTDPVGDRLSVWAFDTETECWSFVEAKGDIPIARSGHALVRASSALILFGGEDAKRRKLNDLHMFDLKSLTWLPLHCIGTGPTPRSNHVAALFEDKMLFVFGGASKSRTLNDLYSLDFETMIWSRIKIRGFHPSPRAGCCGVLCGTKWYIAGGGSRKKRHLDTLVFDILKMEWSMAFSSPPSSITTNKGFTLVLVQHKEKNFLVAFGGSKKEPSNQVEVIGIEKSELSVDQTSAPSKGSEALPSGKRSSSTGLANQLSNGSSHHSFDLVGRQNLASTVEQHGSGRRKSMSESLPADPSSGSSNVSLRQQLYGDEEHWIGVKMTKNVEDGSHSSLAMENRQNQPNILGQKNTAIGRIVVEDAPGSGVFESDVPICHNQAIRNLQCDTVDVMLPDTDCAVGSAHSSVYQIYESKIAGLIRKNGILEGQLAAALANQEAAEKSLSNILKSRQEMERKFAGTVREMELLKEKLASLELAYDEANSLSSIVHSDNVRLEHDVAFLKASLDETRKELHTTRGVLAQERSRAFQLQVEVFHLKQRLQTLESRAPTPRKPFQA